MLAVEPHHDEPVGQLAEGVDGLLDVLVGEQPRDDEVVAARLPVGELGDGGLLRGWVHAVRGVDDGRLVPVDTADPVADDARVGRIRVGAACCAAVPPAQSGSDREEDQADGAAVRRAAQVVLGLVDPASWVVAVNDPLAGGPEAVGPPAAGDQHDVGRDSEGGGDEGEERQGETVVAAQDTDPVERRGDDPCVLELGVGALRVVQGRVDRGVGVGAQHGENDPLRAPTLGEVVVRDGDRGAGG